MAAVATLIALEPAAIDQAVILAISAGTAESIRPTCLLQGSLTLLLGAVEPLEVRQGETFLELDAAARHERTGIYVPFYRSKAAAAERTG